MGAKRAATALALWTVTAPAVAVDLQGTAYERAADTASISAPLLYAVTLVESRRPAAAPGQIKPWPWVIRTPVGGQWYDSRGAAEAALQRALEQYSLYEIDVGAAQINLGWQAHRYNQPANLLSLERNLEVAAEVLAESKASTDDPALAVGRYHTWSNTERATAYGEWVRAIANRIENPQDRRGPQWTTQWQERLARSTSS